MDLHLSGPDRGIASREQQRADSVERGIESGLRKHKSELVLPEVAPILAV
jgi:hypothetical protein